MSTRTPLDLDELAARATAAAQDWRPGVRVGSLAALAGGQSSLTFRGDADGTSLVLKVAPPGLEPLRDRDVLRQARALRALRGVNGMKVPEVLFEDRGEPPAVPPFFAAEFVAGRSFEPHLDEPAETLPDEAIGARAREAAALLALLHAQDPALLGLGDEPSISVAQEIDRWERAFSTVTDLVGPRAAEIVAALRATQPRGLPPAIVHGDFRLGNMLASGSSVTAIIDWEIWSRSDPRIDVAWFLLCADANAHPTAVRRHPGMPTADALLGVYRAAGGADVADLRWFSALALTKMAATTALIAKHNRRAGQDEAAARTAASVPTMIEHAWAAVTSRQGTNDQQEECT